MKKTFKHIVAVLIAAASVCACTQRSQTVKVSGHIIDPQSQEQYDGTLSIKSGKIIKIKREGVAADAPYIVQGYADTPVHIENTLLTPENYAANAVRSGVIASELEYDRIVDILGKDGEDFIKANCSKVHFHFDLKAGRLRRGDNADFILIDNLEDCNVLATYIDGLAVYENGELNEALFWKGEMPQGQPNIFGAVTISTDDIKSYEGYDQGSDKVKMVKIDRFGLSAPIVSFVNGLGLKKGAIASSIADGTQDIIAIGVNDSDIAAAINLIVEQKGGIVVVSPDDILSLPLPIAGLLSPLDAGTVYAQYEKLKDQAIFQGYEFDSFGFDFRGL